MLFAGSVGNQIQVCTFLFELTLKLRFIFKISFFFNFLQNCKKLTDEVLLLRPQVDELSSKVQEWEGTHKVDVQKLALLEAQKSQLTCEKEDASTVSRRSCARQKEPDVSYADQ